jgi:very-short-patch-repair endonuclease
MPLPSSPVGRGGPPHSWGGKTRPGCSASRLVVEAAGLASPFMGRWPAARAGGAFPEEWPQQARLPTLLAAECDQLQAGAMRPARTVRARKLRSEMTRVEWKLWSRLSRRQVAGFKFRRQAPIGPYFVDFYCPALRLVIEVDGPLHGETVLEDAERDRWLIRQGYRVFDSALTRHTTRLTTFWRPSIGRLVGERPSPIRGPPHKWEASRLEVEPAIARLDR